MFSDRSVEISFVVSILFEYIIDVIEPWTFEAFLDGSYGVKPILYEIYMLRTGILVEKSLKKIPMKIPLCIPPPRLSDKTRPVPGATDFLQD